MSVGDQIAAEAIDLEIYQLACSFAGSGQLRCLADNHSSFDWLRRTFEQSEAARRLIGLAVMFRNRLDVRPGCAGEHVVGRLVRDPLRPGESNELSFREACNKIIHAHEVDFFPDAPGHEERPPLASTIKLVGTRSNRRWEAWLDVFAFLNAACTQS